MANIANKDRKPFKELSKAGSKLLCKEHEIFLSLHGLGFRLMLHSHLLWLQLYGSKAYGTLKWYVWVYRELYIPIHTILMFRMPLYTHTYHFNVPYAFGNYHRVALEVLPSIVGKYALSAI